MGKQLRFRMPAYAAAIMLNAVILNLVVLTLACAQESKPASKEPKLGKKDAKAVTLTGTVVDQDDRPVIASVHLQNKFVEIDVTLQTDPHGKFETTVRMEDNRVAQLQIVATAENGSLLGFYRAGSNGEGDRAIKIKLEPARSAKVKVVGADEKPIEAANVTMQLDYPNTLSPALTDSNGVVELKLPASEKILSVVAWKDHFGLDYKLYTLPRGQDKDQLTKPPQFPIDTGEQLVLEGASPLTVRIVDTNDKPIPGMGAYVWLLRKEDAAEELNLSFFTQSFNEQANEHGDVVFNWFPSWQKSTTTVWPSAVGKSAEDFVHTRGNYEPAKDNGSLKMVLERLIPIRGTVTFPDGKPAVGIAVGANGAG